MTPYQDSTSHVHSVGNNGGFYNGNGSADYYSAVRPVIILKKTFLGDVDESIIIDNKASDKQMLRINKRIL